MSLISRHGLIMRKKFLFPSRSNFWFPGHMDTGIKNMKMLLRKVDFVIEIHDVRLPVTGRHTLFSEVMALRKPTITIYNKVDLLPNHYQPIIREYLERKGCNHFMFAQANKRNKRFFRQVVSQMIENLDPRFYLASKDMEYFKCMVVGVPNVGKSTFLNSLRTSHTTHKNAAIVGAAPGVTRAVQERVKICEDPLVYMMDTPGVLQPLAREPEVVLKLALANTVDNKAIGYEIIADYLLYRMNYEGNHSYTKYSRTPPIDDFQQFCLEGTKNRSMYVRKRDYSTDGKIRQMPNVTGFVKEFVAAFHDGAFGKLMIDEVELMQDPSKTITN